MELGTTWNSGRCLCLWQGVGRRLSLRSLPSQTILQFYEKAAWSYSGDKQNLWNSIYSLLRASKSCQWDTHDMLLPSEPGSSHVAHIESGEDNDVLSREPAPAAGANNKWTHGAQWMKCEISSVISTHTTVNQAFLRASADQNFQLSNLRSRQERTGPCPTPLRWAKRPK